MIHFASLAGPHLQSGWVAACESWLLSYLLNSLWQMPLLAAGGWIFARLLRRVGALAEHRVWVGVLLGQAVLPAFSTMSWSWAADWWASLQRVPSPAHAGITVQVAGGTLVGGFSFLPPLLAATAVIYAGSVVFFAARFGVRCVRLARMRREASELSLVGNAAQGWDRCARRFGIDRVALATSPRLFGPVTLGLRRHVVLMPPAMLARLSDGDLGTVIAHEFAHIARNDFLKNLLYEMVSVPVLYHPLFRLTRERMMESREIVCDGMAAGAARHDEYARSLLRLAALLVNGAPVRTPHAIGIFDANTFERRVMRLTNQHTELKGLRRIALIALCAALGVATCGTAVAVGLRVDADSTKPGTTGQKNPSTVNVSASVMQGNVFTKTAPVYPVEAKKEHVQGKVLLDAVIGKDGSVENLKVISGPTKLQQSALDAVRQWKYKPFLLNGQPVAVDTTVTVTYSLTK